MWPDDFPTIPCAEWTEQLLEELAMKYDTVEEHGWYDNLNRTVEQILERHDASSWILDYSGGTGILSDRIIKAAADKAPQLLIVDSSPKFLRMALEKLRVHPNVAYRLIQYIRAERRLQRLDEILPPSLYARGMDAIVSTNAVHLYYQLQGTLRSWFELLNEDGFVYVQSGNIRNPAAPEGSWIIDETVEQIHRTSIELVKEDPSYAQFRPFLQDQAYMAAHDSLREKYFIPVRPLSYYEGALEAAGFEICGCELHSIQARVDQWYSFLEVYHEGVLGWVGGAQKITGNAIDSETLRLRKELIWASMQRMFNHADFFDAAWTYITAQKRRQ